MHLRLNRMNSSALRLEPGVLSRHSAKDSRIPVSVPQSLADALRCRKKERRNDRANPWGRPNQSGMFNEDIGVLLRRAGNDIRGNPDTRPASRSGYGESRLNRWSQICSPFI